MSNNLKSALTDGLKELRLPTMRGCYEDLARKAEQNSLTYEQFLLELTEVEVSARRNNKVERLLRESHLPLEKTLSTFDLKRLPNKVSLQAKALLDGAFLERRENVLAFGTPGSGKTHLLCAIAQELVRQRRPVFFTTCALLVQQLLAAKKELKLAKVLKKFSNYNAILIDDIGYVQQNREEMEVLFTFLADRYEHASLLITSNLPFSKWENIFKDPMTTAAAIDRLVHHCVILELNVPSFRVEKAKLTQAAASYSYKAKD
jgi:DNA replication protein DnaC